MSPECCAGRKSPAGDKCRDRRGRHRRSAQSAGETVQRPRIGQRSATPATARHRRSHRRRGRRQLPPPSPLSTRVKISEKPFEFECNGGVGPSAPRKGGIYPVPLFPLVRKGGWVLPSSSIRFGEN